MRLPRRYAPRNDSEAERPLALLSCAPRRGAFTTNCDKPVPPFLRPLPCLQAQAVEKAPAARRRSWQNRRRTCRYVEDSDRTGNNADGVLSAAATHEQGHDGFLDV